MDAALAQRRSCAIAVGNKHAFERNCVSARVPDENSNRCNQLQNPGPVYASTVVEETDVAGSVGTAPRRFDVAIERQGVLLVSRREDSVRDQSVEEHGWLARAIRLR